MPNVDTDVNIQTCFVELENVPLAVPELKEGDQILYKTAKGWSPGHVVAVNGDKVLIGTANARKLTRLRGNVKPAPQSDR